MEPIIFLKHSLLSPKIPKSSPKTLNQNFNLCNPAIKRDTSVHNHNDGTPSLTLHVLSSLFPLPISSLSTQNYEILSWVAPLFVSSLAVWLVVPISLYLWAEIALSGVRTSYLLSSVVFSILELASLVVLLFRSAGRLLRRGFNRRRADSFKILAALLIFSVNPLLLWWRVGTWHRWPSRLQFLKGALLFSLPRGQVWCLSGVLFERSAFSPVIRWSPFLSLAQNIKLYCLVQLAACTLL